MMPPATGHRTPATVRETDLYEPIRDYLAAQGYTVRAEVSHCDITARKGDDLIVIELKRQFGIDLLAQATARQRLSDSVYVAFPAPSDMRTRRWRGIVRILRQLELGLILVFHAEAAPASERGQPRIEVAFHPLPYVRQKRKSARRAVLEEMAQRSGDYNQGGAVRRKLVTAYRENAIWIACCLEQFGPLAPRRLRELGTGPKTLSILYTNVYGWFDRVGRGLYALAARGRDELRAYPELTKQYRAKLDLTAPAASHPVGPFCRNGPREPRPRRRKP